MKTYLTLVLLIASVAVAQGQQIFSTSDGAIKGYDPVAYFTEGEPVKGGKAYSYEWNGATWHFSSEKNLALFKENPEKYAPQYGGYCAYGLANGYKVKIEPDAWAIIDDKLYLNYDRGVQKEWSKDKEALIRKANANWPKLRNQIVE